MRAFTLISIAAAAVLVPSTAQASTVVVVHGVPGLVATVEVDGVQRLQGFAPGQITDPVPIAPGGHRVAVVGENVDATLNGRVRVPQTGRISLAAHLDEQGDPKLTTFRDAPAPLQRGRTRIVFRHTAAAPAVTLQVDGKSVAQGVSNGDSRAAVLPAGRHRVAIMSGGDTVWGPEGVDLRAGSSYIVYAIGSVEDGTLDQLVDRIVGAPRPPSRVDTGLGRLFGDVSALLKRRGFGSLAAPAPKVAHKSLKGRQSRLRRLPSLTAASPSSIRIPAIGADSRVVASAADGRGNLVLPNAPGPVAWYRWGAAPGERGATLLAGHVAWRGHAGPFARLAAAKRGDVVIVGRRGRPALRYRIVAVRLMPKEGIEALPALRSTRDRRLVLVTCGGRYRAANGHYADNVVAVAVPIGR